MAHEKVVVEYVEAAASASASAAAAGGDDGENQLGEVGMAKNDVMCLSFSASAAAVAVAVMRVLAFMATLVATEVMAANKQKKTIVVATIGTTPIQATLTAKFQHTPAFIFFVIANGMVSLHNLLMLMVELIGHKFDKKGLRFTIIPILDMMNVALLSGGISGAIFMGQLGREGNSHARWNKICDKFETYCNHGTAAMASSLLGLLLIITLNFITISNVRKFKHFHNICNNNN